MAWTSGASASSPRISPPSPSEDGRALRPEDFGAEGRGGGRRRWRRAERGGWCRRRHQVGGPAHTSCSSRSPTTTTTSSRRRGGGTALVPSLSLSLSHLTVLHRRRRVAAWAWRRDDSWIRTALRRAMISDTVLLTYMYICAAAVMRAGSWAGTGDGGGRQRTSAARARRCRWAPRAPTSRRDSDRRRTVHGSGRAEPPRPPPAPRGANNLFFPFFSFFTTPISLRGFRCHLRLPFSLRAAYAALGDAARRGGGVSSAWAQALSRAAWAQALSRAACRPHP